MVLTPAEPAGSPVASPGALQPDVEGRLRPVPRGWLREHEDSPEARNVDRLLADVDLMTRLALNEFEGSEYEQFAVELVRYGLAVIAGWLRRGVMLAKAAERGFGGLPDPPLGAFDDPDTCLELANETVARAHGHFRRNVLMKNRWDASRGATIRTFFIGQCLFHFPNIYRSWYRSEARHTLEDLGETALGRAESSSVVDPAHVAEQRIYVLQGLARISDMRVRTALIMTGKGHSQHEIAEHLNVTEKTVERMLANHRDRIRREGIA